MRSYTSIHLDDDTNICHDTVKQPGKLSYAVIRFDINSAIIFADEANIRRLREVLDQWLQTRSPDLITPANVSCS